MLTRLRVQGFKNLVDVDVRFGPFTCIAGLNGVGKSNLFDAILFLSALADQSLLEAATGVRHETRSAEAGRIFTRIGDVVADALSLPADPEAVSDPKVMLHEALRVASGLPLRRRRKFQADKAQRMLPHHIESYAPLRKLSAFRRFEADAVRVMATLQGS